MAAGLAATAIAVIRLCIVMGYGPGGFKGPYLSVVSDILWGFELCIGVLTASVPTLKAPIHRHLLAWGVIKDTDASSDAPPESFLDQLTQGSHFTHQMRQWDTIKDGNNRPFMYQAPKKTDNSGSTDTRVNDVTPPLTTVSV